jgi:predicted RNase H-like nuclease (RuvC/YqgF family)
MVLISPEGERLCTVRVRRKDLADLGIQHNQAEAVAHVAELAPADYRLTEEALRELTQKVANLLSWGRSSTFSLVTDRRAGRRKVSHATPDEAVESLREALSRSRKNQRDTNRQLDRCLQEQSRLRQSLKSSQELKNKLEAKLQEMTQRVTELSAECQAKSECIERLTEERDLYRKECVDLAESLHQYDLGDTQDSGKPAEDSPFL